jgi:hypothetical protein
VPRRGGTEDFCDTSKKQNPSPYGHSSSSLRLSEPNGLFQRENKILDWYSFLLFKGGGELTSRRISDFLGRGE